MTYTEKEIEAATDAVTDECGSALCSWTDNKRECWADRHPAACNCKQVAIAALSAVPREPEGWRLVPVKPSNDQKIAMLMASGGLVVRTIYQAGLDAAPRYGEGK